MVFGNVDLSWNIFCDGSVVNSYCPLDNSTVGAADESAELLEKSSQKYIGTKTVSLPPVQRSGRLRQVTT